MTESSTIPENGVVDSLTVLSCAQPGRFASKLIRADGSVADFNAGSMFHRQEVPAASVFDLHNVIEACSRMPEALIIRGGLSQSGRPRSLFAGPSTAMTPTSTRPRGGG